MVVEERARRALQEALMESLGADNADTLLGYLPPVGWADVATKRDLDALRAELRGEIRELSGEFGELRGEFGELRGEFGTLRADLSAQQQTQFYRTLMVQVAVLAMVIALLSSGLAG
jgi:hypothetical protein